MVQRSEPILQYCKLFVPFQRHTVEIEASRLYVTVAARPSPPFIEKPGGRSAMLNVPNSLIVGTMFHLLHLSEHLCERTVAI